MNDTERWQKLLSTNRHLGKEIATKNNAQQHRTSFHKDYDRLIFSNSFRRLSKKTQVHPLSNNDHIHNRLTHSLEVASVGRSLGLHAGKILQDKYPNLKCNPEDTAYIIQTACLAHDIGNPPFGHAGEEVIKSWFLQNRSGEYFADLTDQQIADFIHLDGNAQSFRILTNLADDFGNNSMRLTCATLGTLVKYPYSSANCQQSGKSKFNFFQSEAGNFDILFDELGLKTDGKYARHPFSYLMEAADDICYGLIDLQDAVELKIINFADSKEIFRKLCPNDIKNIENNKHSDIKKVARLVGIAINNLAVETMQVFADNLDDLLHGSPDNLISLFQNTNLQQGINEAKQLGVDKIFNDQRKVELELGSYNIIETLLDNLINATFDLYKNGENISFKNKRVLQLMAGNKPLRSANLYQMYQTAIDYLVNMTDNYATHIAKQLRGFG